MSHDHTHSVPDTPEKMQALLAHLCEHNEDHAHELEHLGEALEHAGKEEAAKKLAEAVKLLDQGNALARQALDALK
ncbi:MAG: hypothetical protein K6E92_05230 [Lachnospiraceae bacterium]|nr:hypothetical protein [Lachnospiraceae bacterium]